MKERKRGRFIPKSLIKSLSADIKNLMENNEGRLFALEIMEDIPPELRPIVIDSLSCFYEQEMVLFFYLLREEYGKELEIPINRALEKYQMAGIPVNPPVFYRGGFYRAFATRTRHTGQLTVDIAWKNQMGSLDIECFFLSYCNDGISNSFVVSELSFADYDKERESLSDIVEINLAEAAYLVREAYSFNIKYMTRPGLGRFLFQKFLDMPCNLSEQEKTALLLKLSGQLSPQQLVNSFFYAQRYQDIAYISSILGEGKALHAPFVEYLKLLVASPTLLIEGQVSRTRIGGDYAYVKAYAISVDEEQVYHSEYSFYLKRHGGRWLIVDLCRDIYQVIGDSDPVSVRVFCNVYEVMDIDELLTSLDEIENIREVGELPYGVHLRIAKHEDDLSQGVFFLTGVLADLIINGEELVVITKSQESLDVLHHIITRNSHAVFVTRHEVNALTAYRYLSGQYLSFRDILGESGAEKLFEDGMKFLSARYVIRDRERILLKLEKLRAHRYQLPGDYHVFYEYREREDGIPGEFIAEYVLGGNWVTVSAFGDKEIGMVRSRFEKGIKECLEFEGLEIKQDGLFEILTREVKEQYPNLEEAIKKAYLEKWYRSQLKPLKGLSPAQARESFEGRQLLWEMFKKMNYQKRSRRQRGSRSYLNLGEYFKKVKL